MEFYIGQIIMFGGDFAIRNFALAEGQLLAISQHNALFSLYGTIYGGDGRTTFGLPDLRGRVPIQHGHGPGLPSYRLGERGGYPTTTLIEGNLPAHSHTMVIPVQGDEGEEDASNPAGAFLANTGADNFASSASSNSFYGQGLRTANTGANLSFSNQPPYLAINYEVCLYGLYPSRN